MGLAWAIIRVKWENPSLEWILHCCAFKHILCTLNAEQIFAKLLSEDQGLSSASEDKVTLKQRKGRRETVAAMRAVFCVFCGQTVVSPLPPSSCPGLFMQYNHLCAAASQTTALNRGEMGRSSQHRYSAELRCREASCLCYLFNKANTNSGWMLPSILCGYRATVTISDRACLVSLQCCWWVWLSKSSRQPFAKTFCS